jgi:hypothetical protein
MNEIAPAIFHWTAFHQPISGRVSSYFIAPARVVIDPKRPEEDGWDALPERPEQVLLTSGHHPDRVKKELKQAFSGLLERDFAHLLFAHGEPLVAKGKTELRQFIESPAGHEAFGAVL